LSHFVNKYGFKKCTFQNLFTPICYLLTDSTWVLFLKAVNRSSLDFHKILLFGNTTKFQDSQFSNHFTMFKNITNFNQINQK